MFNRVKINHQIQAAELRVIDEVGGNLGVMRLAEALGLADQKGLDLIEIAPTASPPVAKIMDFGKYQYLENKKQKLSRGRTHLAETKSIQIKIGTGEHDLAIKGGKVSGFLKEGHRVKAELFLPGRAKYLDRKFLETRLGRLLQFVTVEYKVALPAQRTPKGIALVLERK